MALRNNVKLTCVTHEHDKVLLGNEGVQEVGEAGGVHSGHKQAGKAVWHVREAGHFIVPWHHAAGGVVYIVVKHYTLQGTKYLLQKQTFEQMSGMSR